MGARRPAPWVLAGRARHASTACPFRPRARSPPSTSRAEHRIFHKPTDEVPQDKVALLDLGSVARRHCETVVTLLDHRATPITGEPYADEASATRLFQREKNVERLARGRIRNENIS